MELTTLDKGYGERLQVPFYGWDDTGLSYTTNSCTWTATKKHTLAIFYKKKKTEDILVAGASPVFRRYKWMLPLEGGGAVAWKTVIPAQPCDLGINPDIIVSDIGPRNRRTRSRRSPFRELNFVNHKFVGRVADPTLVLQTIDHVLSWERGRFYSTFFDVCFCYWMHDVVVNGVLFEIRTAKGTEDPTAKGTLSEPAEAASGVPDPAPETRIWPHIINREIGRVDRSGNHVVMFCWLRLGCFGYLGHTSGQLDRSGNRAPRRIWKSCCDVLLVARRMLWLSWALLSCRSPGSPGCPICLTRLVCSFACLDLEIML